MSRVLRVIETEGGSPPSHICFRVEYMRNKRVDHMFIFAATEVEAFQKAAKCLGVMNKRETKLTYARKTK